MIKYTLKRSNRKNVTIYIRNGEVEVRAPLKIPQKDIDKIVASKQKWIEDRLVISKEQHERRENFSLAYGDEITYMGRRYPIAAKPGDRVGFDEKCFYMPPGLPSDHIKHACVQIYRMLAKRTLTNKVIDFAKKMSVSPTAVRITGAKTRWGSCSSKKSLNFSWRLMMADDDVIDYLVVHELAHITEMNHSPRFWAIVASELPDYRDRENKLKELQKKLRVENWE